MRSLALGVYPALNAALNAGLDLLYAPDVPAVRTVAVAVSGLLKRTILAFQQPHFTQAAVVGLLFAAVLALNWVERRFWCRYLCPLGALLGVVGRWSLLKRNVSEGCTSCGLCDHGCQGGASTGDYLFSLFALFHGANLWPLWIIFLTFSGSFDSLTKLFWCPLVMCR